ncbi:DUF551 domain-containing protein [Escherichia sp. E4385]|uniref:DUF551 domain-containing protein n=1 Tax=Escherichia sp. E4385 TaxID=2040639 RepID=UPI00107F633F|nr:DUF551 domain-containing protein [Escherichia sp. E4385]TGC16508.1 hypothetical protein CRU79_09485 [Escherichia sp. E4385]TLI94336.1 DUF551 domain-containing protein [Escherichia sp. E4385]
MATITRESAEIKSFITGFLSDSAHDNQSSNSLLANVFRIALASLEAEPVAYQYRQWDAEYDEWGEWEDCGECVYEGFVEEEKCQGAGVQTRKLYAAPPISVTPDGWISRSERMPNDAQWCVVNTEYGYYVQCWSEGQGWLGDDISIPECDVINWMPLPEPPQEVNQ